MEWKPGPDGRRCGADVDVIFIYIVCNVYKIYDTIRMAVIGVDDNTSLAHAPGIELVLVGAYNATLTQPSRGALHSSGVAGVRGGRRTRSARGAWVLWRCAWSSGVPTRRRTPCVAFSLLDASRHDTCLRLLGVLVEVTSTAVPRLWRGAPDDAM